MIIPPCRLAVIDGHPDPDPGRFVHALARSYADGAISAGHELRTITVAELDFPILRDRRSWDEEPPPPAIAHAQETISWADHLFIVYPLWLGDMPAMLKAFFEQVMRPGFAFDPAQGRFPRKKLKGRTACVAVTMGMPALFYRAYYGAHSVRSLERNILRFVGIRPTDRMLIGNVETDAESRNCWLQEAHDLGAAGG